MPKLKTGKDLAVLSKKLYKKHKLPSLVHSIGHGIGLQVHECPRLGMKSKDRLKGTVMALEPAVYYEEFGIRYEENVYFDGKRARVL